MKYRTRHARFDELKLSTLELEFSSCSTSSCTLVVHGPPFPFATTPGTSAAPASAALGATFATALSFAFALALEVPSTKAHTYVKTQEDKA